MDIDDFLAGRDESRRIFELLRAAVLSLGPVEVRFTRSQVAFVFGRPFAWAWAPEMHLRRKAAPLVLTLSFAARRESSRWKEIYEAKPGHFTHHLELWTGGEIDGEVVDWLREARDSVSSDSLGHRRSRPAP